MQLKRAFPSFKGIAAKLKDFVNIEWRADRNFIEFCYEELRIGRHCNLSDEVIGNAIISIINNNLIRASAQAAKCHTPKKLLEFLTQVI